jgi:hypothetical protein
MKLESNEWLPLDTAARQFGYSHKESLSRRLRQLRGRKLVIDIGRPPPAYRNHDSDKSARIVIMWPNPKTALLRSDAPPELFSVQRGRPPNSR